MQITTSRTDNCRKDKPMQKSMMTPEHHPSVSISPTPRIILDTTGINSLKRSSLSVMETTPRLTSPAPPSQINPSYGQNSQYQNPSPLNYCSLELRKPFPYETPSTPTHLPNAKHSQSMVHN
jgi:hypothetical protein